MNYEQWESEDAVGTFTTINASGVDIPDGARYRVIRDKWTDDFSTRTLLEVQVLAPNKAVDRD